MGQDGVIADGALECIEEAVRDCDSAHINYKNFFVARTTDGKPVASCEAYFCPEFTVDKTYDILGPIVSKRLGWSEDVYKSNVDKMSFLNECFPEDIPYSGSWFLETIYTDPEYRGKGLSSQLILRCLEEGRQRGAARSIIIFADGNVGAHSVYSKQGFQVVGEAFSDKAIPILGCNGFVIMKLDL